MLKALLFSGNEEALPLVQPSNIILGCIKVLTNFDT